MAWLDYDKHVDILSTMDNKVGVTSPKSTIQTLPSFKEYTLPVTYLEEVEKTLGTLIEVEPLNKTKLEEVGLNCNHNTPFSSREVPSFDGPEPQPLLTNPSLDVSLGDVIGLEPPIKPHSSDSSRMKSQEKKKKEFDVELCRVCSSLFKWSSLWLSNQISVGGGLILYQAYGNLYAMTGKKAHLLGDKQIPSVGAFGGNTRDLGSILEETGQDCNFSQRRLEELLIEGGDGVRIPCDAVWN
ncbi:hypothetical protein Tco_0355511 [Tanacetum coccineum]